MADVSLKVEKNVDGPYFVDEQCIACNACVVEAPAFFEMDDDNCYAFVSKQPTTEQEIELCENAISVCPVEAIGKV